MIIEFSPGVLIVHLYTHFSGHDPNGLLYKKLEHDYIFTFQIFHKIFKFTLFEAAEF